MPEQGCCVLEVTAPVRAYAASRALLRPGAYAIFHWEDDALGLSGRMASPAAQPVQRWSGAIHRSMSHRARSRQATRSSTVPVGVNRYGGLSASRGQRWG